MKNKFVAEILYQIADLLDIKGEIFFKSRAYRIAAQKIETLDEDIKIISKENRLQSIDGIGEVLANKIKEIIETNKLEYFEKLKNEIPDGLLNLLDIPGLGAKKVSALYKNLSITNIDELKNACIEGKISSLEGFGEITEQNILRGIAFIRKISGRILLNVADENSLKIIKYLKKCNNIKNISIAGSLRRMKETIGDLDILVSANSHDIVMNYFIRYPEIKNILSKGNTKTSILLNNDIQVDLRVVNNNSYGSALQYFTGSKEHNVKMRSIAIRNNFKLNEYGIFNKKTNEYIGGKTEKEVYNLLNLKYIEPELRENRGEIEFSLNDKLPKIIEYNTIKGDLHVHSNWSDGNNSIEEIVRYSKRIGYEYVGITDHSQSLRIANGLSENRINNKIKEIKKINRKLTNLKVLCGTECDIKPNGELDYNNRILEKFDYVGIGIHSSFRMTKKEMTNRLIKAIENEHVNFLTHPTCRIIGRREPIDVDLEKIFNTAVETNTFFEINAFPDRLDLNDINLKHAKEIGVKFIIGTDSHNINHLKFMRYGIATARRGWLTKNDVLNTFNLEHLVKKFGCAI